MRSGARFTAPRSSTKVALAIGAAMVLLLATAVWLGREPNTGRTVVHFRLWDNSFVSAYRASFDELERRDPHLEVRIDVVPFASYAEKLRLDVAGGTADDLFWVNSFEDYADAHRILDIDAALGPDAKDAWDPAAVAQYTRRGALWAVPQFVDAGTALFYNRNLLEKAGASPHELADLRWGGTDDTLLPLLRRLTLDRRGHHPGEPGFNPDAIAQWGYNAGNDYQSILLPFVGSAGGEFQDAADHFAFASPQGARAFRYLVDLINREYVAPSAADTNTDGDFARNQFLQGRLALFQSGTFNLRQVAEGAHFGWGVAMLPRGPAGRVSADNAIAVAGNADSRHPAAVREVLRWLGSTEGNRALGAGGLTIPAARDVQGLYREYWRRRGVDVSPFFDVLRGRSLPSQRGARFSAAQLAIDDVLDEMFLGRIPVPPALAQAQRAGNDALAGR